ncbi:DUF7003 family protein [Bacillus licheniformis]|uniref:DUF7003 family protein n=1 Tax=Bacillus licheniformis TaxID=1402 RepID=UPI00119F3EF6|nr:hypothetical protein [Bacillus licheniformis]MBU8737549.1 hypothetical protein [Bacillus licheniformis]MCY7773870.1 hypothetical protein [Bacillus licheniformis]MCY8158569.1 hypothetical protein [Bacillus licheniformis]MCY8528668.1 hypothetical protein [Bacillus licheniformis]MCY8743219.1 hypothetical protein [Bacillus licheniformis]
MLKNKEAILALLDDSFKKGEFPLLDNGNFDFAKGKLSVFVEGDNWLLTFQLFGLSKLGPAIDFHAMGNQVTNHEVSFLVDEPFAFLDEKGNKLELEDVETGFVKNPFSVVLREKVFHFFIEQEVQANMNAENEWITCLRQMSKNRLFLDTLWLTKHEQLQTADLPLLYDQLYSTETWIHPETEKDLPSLSPFFQSIAEAICRKDESCIQQRGDRNTEWSKWAHTDSVHYF